MKKMITALLVIVGLAVCGLLVLRHHRRANAPVAGATATTSPILTPPSRPTPPMDAFQSGVKLDRKTEYTPDAEARRRLLEKLRREEQRQRPQEQRN